MNFSWRTVFFITLGLVVVVLFFLGKQSPKYRLDGQTFIISDIYGLEIPISDITSIDLKDTYPNIIRKIDGFSIGNLRKGNYVLEGFGEKRLYIINQSAPFIFLESRKKNVIFNLDTSQETIEIYETIIQAHSRIEARHSKPDE